MTHASTLKNTPPTLQQIAMGLHLAADRSEDDDDDQVITRAVPQRKISRPRMLSTTVQSSGPVPDAVKRHQSPPLPPPPSRSSLKKPSSPISLESSSPPPPPYSPPAQLSHTNNTGKYALTLRIPVSLSRATGYHAQPSPSSLQSAPPLRRNSSGKPYIRSCFDDPDPLPQTPVIKKEVRFQTFVVHMDDDSTASTLSFNEETDAD